MYKVLIAEDEMLVRLGLKNSIDWGKFDMEVIADVSDGKSAWEVYQNESPDFIMTDIKMPVMDGMELISKIRQVDSKTQIVILSCLEEFELIRKAMSFGVSEYILKLTMTWDDMESVLQKVYTQLNNQDRLPKTYLQDPMNREAVKENKLKNFLFYHHASDVEFAEFVADLKMKIQPDHLLLGIMEINHFNRLKANFKDDKGQLIKLSVLNVINEIMDSYANGEVICENDTRYIFILNDSIADKTKHRNSVIFEIMKKIIESMHIYFNITVSFGLSSVQSGYSNIISMYTEASRQLESKFLNGPGTFIHGSELDVKRVLDEKKELLLGLCSFLSFADDEFIGDYSEKVCQLMGKLTNSKDSICVGFHQLIHWTLNQAGSMGDNNFDIFNVSKSIDSCETIDEAIEIYRDFILDLNASLRKKKVLSLEITKSVRFIELNYQQNLSVLNVAQHVNLSPNYFSSLFKKEMHINFTEYLNEYRVDQARKLLLETYLKGYEIAEKVGFNDNTYFTRVFKKVTGLNPNEFRKKWLKGWTDDQENENATKG